MADLTKLLTAFPEYRGHGAQAAQIAEALMEIASSPWARSNAPGCAALADRLRDLPHPCTPEAAESRLLELYARVHELGSGYTADERARLNARRGYINYAGGVTPILRAGRYLTPRSVSADLGAGNGLQGLLWQRLYPHRQTIQVELSGALVENGRKMQGLLGIPADRVTWVHGDIAAVSLEGVDFVYLYRPVRPEGDGELLYQRIAERLGDAPSSVTVFSVADCLGRYLDDAFVRVFTDGHLTCFQRKAHRRGGGR